MAHAELAEFAERKRLVDRHPLAGARLRRAWLGSSAVAMNTPEA